MSKKVKKSSKINKIKVSTLTVITLFVASSFFLIYNILLLTGIEDVIRYVLIGCLTLLALIFTIWGFKASKREKAKNIIAYMIIAIMIALLQFAGAYYINKAYASINKLNKNEVTYGTSLVTLKSSGLNTINDLKNKKIGIIDDTNNVEGYIISQEIISTNKISKSSLVEYGDFLSMLKDLYDEKVDAIFISSGYVSMFSSFDSFTDIKNETKVITTKTKTMNKQDNTGNNSNAKITEPFTMLIMGIDSTEEDIASATSFNGDTLILITFNPKTLNATMLSIPRDTFVPITCFKNKIQNKITHAAWYGESCMMDTIENFTGINIDYYAKINFKGVVKLVDAVDGVTVDVPYSFCEQNSNREWGKNTIYVKKGVRILTGEQALAFSRNRHPNPTMCSKEWTNYYSDDFVRGQNQQTVIKALTSKLKDIRDINKLYEILDLMEKSMDTNLSTSQILSFYNIGKSILATTKDSENILNFEKLYLSTRGQYIYDEGMKLDLSDQIYYKKSLEEVVKAMEINLGIKDPTIAKTFSFSINEPYEIKVIGKGSYNEPLLPVVPDFTKYTKQSAINWGLKNNISIDFTTVESSSSKYSDGQITNQNVHSNSLVSLVNKTKGITLTIIKKTISNDPVTEVKTNCTLEENKDKSVCTVPDFKGKKISDVNTWLSKITGFVMIPKITYTNKSNEDKLVIDQTKNVIGKSIYELTERSMIIEYYVLESDE